jgi:opacity protein-like surface antigen
MRIWDKMIAAVGAVLFMAGYCISPAGAADKGGDKSSPLGFLPIGEAVKANSWSGLSIGGYGTWVNADTDTSPISIGSTGYTAGGTIAASLQMGSFVGEVFGDYGWFFGDLKDIGAEREMALGGRLGVLLNQNTLLYGVGAKSWVETEGGTIDGWQYGLGAKMRFASTPTVLSLEYRHGEYEAGGVLPIDLTTDTVRLGISYQFNAK